MEKQLIENLQLIAECNGKTSDLQTYVKNGHGMYLDQGKREIIFNHTLDKSGARKIVDDIISTMNKFGYSAKLSGEFQCSKIVTEYIIQY